MESSSEDKVAPKRTPRKRATGAAAKTTRKVTKKTTTTKRAPRKTSSNRTGSVERVSSAPTRKAPTPIASGKAAKKRSQKQIIIIGAAVILGIGASALIGLSDQGQIDVQKTIADRNERVRTNTTDERDVNTSLVEVPVQSTKNAGKADGGLVGRGTGGKKPQPAPVVATSTATSSDQTASSTEATASSTELMSDENLAPAAETDDGSAPVDTTESSEGETESKVDL